MEWERLTSVEQFVFFLRMLLAVCLIAFALGRRTAARRAMLHGDVDTAVMYRNHAILSLLLFGIGLIANFTDLHLIVDLLRDTMTR